MAVPPVIQPPQENPMTIDATAPIATPCSRRVRDSPRRIDGPCMALAFRSEECARRAARTRALTAPEPNGGAIFDIVPTDGTRLPTVRSGEVFRHSAFP